LHRGSYQPGAYDAATSQAVACFQRATGTGARRSSTGILDAATARAALQMLSADSYTDDGQPAVSLGYKYKILLPVHRNRSIETNATLLDANNRVLLTFPARAHGHDVDASGLRIDTQAWPDLTDAGCPHPQARQGCVGLNQFSTDGNTPTGLSELDLNSPEDEPKLAIDVHRLPAPFSACKLQTAICVTRFVCRSHARPVTGWLHRVCRRLYGPFPVNRFVRGLRGNAAFLVPAIRDGLLIHSGEWANFSEWRPGAPMPNSAGCVHSELPFIHQIWRLLVQECGVVARPNSGGKQPYPFKPQGLVSVFVADDIAS
jgi:hypothetical protein